MYLPCRWRIQRIATTLCVYLGTRSRSLYPGHDPSLRVYVYLLLRRWQLPSNERTMINGEILAFDHIDTRPRAIFLIVADRFAARYFFSFFRFSLLLSVLFRWRFKEKNVLVPTFVEIILETRFSSGFYLIRVSRVLKFYGWINIFANIFVERGDMIIKISYIRKIMPREEESFTC